MAVKSMRVVIALAVCMAIPLFVGGLSAMLVHNQFTEYSQLSMPPGSPPAVIFPIAWTALYIMMGAACFLIYFSSSEARGIILTLYAVQLLLNYLWSPVFFNMQFYWLAAAILMVMWILIIAIIIMALDVNKIAALLLLPYAAWCVYAMYLNLGVMALN